jgi:heptosyltransferase-3
MIREPKKIVISRTDSIGDVVLTLPLTGILKERFPDAKIIFFGNTYTKPVLACCHHIDEIWEWAKFAEKNEESQINWLKEQEIDTFIHVFPRKQLAKVVKKAGIKNRIGTSHRLYHLLTCNYRPNFTRKKSDLHESQLNVKLLAPFGIDKHYLLNELTEFSGFNQLPSLPKKFADLLSPSKTNIILHPKSQGSAIEWGVDNFMCLAKELDPEKYTVFITGTEKEASFFRAAIPKQENVHDLSGKMTLDELIAFISQADMLVAASTGPLHIAGITGIDTIGLFANLRPMHAGRWMPLGKKVVVLEDEKKSIINQPLSISLRSIIKAVELLPVKKK